MLIMLKISHETVFLLSESLGASYSQNEKE